MTEKAPRKKTKKAIKSGLPWYHYRSVWALLIVVPLLTLGASIATIYIASTSNLAGGAHESYFKKGLSPNELAPREQHAKEMGLSAELNVGSDYLRIDFNQPLSVQDLVIKFQHPTLEKFDFSEVLELVDSENHVFRLKKPASLQQHKWDIFVDSPSQGWRVKGRLLKTEDHILLTPFGQ